MSNSKRKNPRTVGAVARVKMEFRGSIDEDNTMRNTNAQPHNYIVKRISKHLSVSANVTRLFAHLALIKGANDKGGV